MATPSYSMSRKGSALPAVLVVIILCVVGFFGWKAFEKYRERKDREQEEIRAKNREINARNEEKRRVKPDEKPETDAAEKVVEDEPKLEMPEPPKKSEHLRFSLPHSSAGDRGAWVPRLSQEPSLLFFQPFASSYLSLCCMIS